MGRAQNALLVLELVETVAEYHAYAPHKTQTVSLRFARGKVKRDLRWRKQENLFLLSNDKGRAIARQAK